MLELSEKKVNINEQDYSNVRVYATTSAGRSFFDGIEGGSVLSADLAYTEHQSTVYIGTLESDADGIISLSDALAISPMKLKCGLDATDYFPVDYLRAFYHGMKKDAYDHLTHHILKRESVVVEESLENKI